MLIINKTFNNSVTIQQTIQRETCQKLGFCSGNVGRSRLVLAPLWSGNCISTGLTHANRIRAHVHDCDTSRAADYLRKRTQLKPKDINTIKITSKADWQIIIYRRCNRLLSIFYPCIWRWRLGSIFRERLLIAPLLNTLDSSIAHSMGALHTRQYAVCCCRLPPNCSMPVKKNRPITLVFVNRNCGCHAFELGVEMTSYGHLLQRPQHFIRETLNFHPSKFQSAPKFKDWLCLHDL